MIKDKNTKKSHHKLPALNNEAHPDVPSHVHASAKEIDNRPSLLKKVVMKLKSLYASIMNKNDPMSSWNSIIKKRDKTTEKDHFEKISHKGTNIYYEKGFSVYNGHENIYLGSNIYLAVS